MGRAGPIRWIRLNVQRLSDIEVETELLTESNVDVHKQTAG